MKRIIKSGICVLISFIRFFFIKIFHWKNFSYNFIERFSLNVDIEIERNSFFYLGKKVRAHSGTKFKVRKNSRLIIKDNVAFNYGCMVFCREQIEIEEGVEFGPNVLIYDHDHDFRIKGGIKAGKYNTSPVFIGQNTWIGANVVILKGSHIGQNCVIAAGSIVKSNVPDNTIYIQKRNDSVIAYAKEESL